MPDNFERFRALAASRGNGGTDDLLPRNNEPGDAPNTPLSQGGPPIAPLSKQARSPTSDDERTSPRRRIDSTHLTVGRTRGRDTDLPLTEPPTNLARPQELFVRRTIRKTFSGKVPKLSAVPDTE